MAQFVDNASHQSAVFGYNPDYLGSMINLPNAPDNSHSQPHPGQSILNENEAALMSSFFQNPNGVSPVGYHGAHWDSMEQRNTAGGYGSGLDGYDQEAQTVHNPAATLANASAPTYQTHSNQQHVNMAGQNVNDYLPHQNSQADDEDFKAASGLYTMLNQAQDNSHAAAFGTGPAASWGALAMPLSQMNGPSNFFDANPSNSYPDNTHSPSHAQQQQNHHGMAQDHLRQQYFQQQYFPQAVQAQAQAQAQAAHARQASLQVSHNSRPQEATIAFQQTRARGGSSGQAGVAISTDPNFTSTGYMGGNAHSSRVNGKHMNLVGVPMAQEARAHVQGGFTGQMGSHVYSQFPAMQTNGGYAGFQRAISSSPYNNSIHGLPNAGMMAAGHSHAHPLSSPLANQVPVAYHEDGEAEESSEEDDESDEDGVVVQQPAAKRRKSELNNHDDEDEPKYASGSKSKGKGKAVATANDDDSDYDPAPSAKPAAARRKSRASLSSSVAASSSPAASPGTGLLNPRKRGRSSGGRPNLTEEQKRENHIRSEKNRRMLIKQNYDQLDEMVPALKGGQSGLSKSDVLKEIATYIQSVIAGNAKVENELEERAKAGGAGAAG